MFAVLTLFVRGLAQGAFAAVCCFVVLAVSFAAIFFVLVCGAPLKRLQR